MLILVLTVGVGNRTWKTEMETLEKGFSFTISMTCFEGEFIFEIPQLQYFYQPKKGAVTVTFDKESQTLALKTSKARARRRRVLVKRVEEVQLQPPAASERFSALPHSSPCRLPP